METSPAPVQEERATDFAKPRWWRVAVFATFGLLLAVLIPSYWIALHAPAVGLFHDDGVYLVTAKALATGHGYRIISLPDEIPQTKYPILFPLVLSVVWRLAPDFPANVFALKLVPFIFALVWFWLVYRLIRLEASREVAAVCAIFTAAMLWTLYLSTALLSETMFAAICTGSLLILRRVELGASRGYVWMVAAVLAGLACLTRTAGVCMVAAGAISIVQQRRIGLRQRRIGRAAGFLAIALAVCAPWFLWVATQHPPETDAYYSAANYASWNVLSSHFPLDRKLVVVIINAVLLLRGPLAIADVPLNGMVEAFAGLAMALAALRWLRPVTVVEIFMAIYVAMMLAWAWPPDRFLVVIYPLLLFAVWKVFHRVLQRFPRYSVLARTVGGVVLVAIAIQCLWNLADGARKTRNSGIVLGKVESGAWPETLRAVNWIRENTPPDAVVLANVDPVFYLYTGRKAVRGFQADPYRLFYMTEPGSQPLGTLDDFRKTVRNDRVSYIVRAPNDGFSEAPYLDRLILELVQSEPDSIRLVEQGRDSRFKIYRVERPL